MILSSGFPKSNYLILSSFSSRNFFSGKHYGLCKGRGPESRRPDTKRLFRRFSVWQIWETPATCATALCICIVYLHSVFKLCIAQMLYLENTGGSFSCVLCIFVCVFHKLYFCVVYFTDCIFALCIS